MQKQKIKRIITCTVFIFLYFVTALINMQQIYFSLLPQKFATKTVVSKNRFIEHISFILILTKLNKKSNRKDSSAK